MVNDERNDEVKDEVNVLECNEENDVENDDIMVIEGDKDFHGDDDEIYILNVLSIYHICRIYRIYRICCICHISHIFPFFIYFFFNQKNFFWYFFDYLFYFINFFNKMLNLHKFVADDYYKKGKANFKVQDGEGNEYPVVMTMNSTVFDLKEEIHYKYNKSIVEMTLYYHGKKLDNNTTLQDCKFEEPDDIILQTKPLIVKYNYC